MKNSESEKKMISVIIPVLNEEASLGKLYTGIIRNLPADRDKEIWFIDDGSTDSSVAVIKEIMKTDCNVHLISFRKNFGKAMALETGFRNVSGDIIITMDADLQDDPAELPRFIEKIEEGFDVVSGWKQKRQDPLEKRLPSRLFNRVISKASGIDLHDFNCGFKAYRKEVVDAIDVYGELHRYIPCLAARLGFSITEIAVHHNKREYGKSKYGRERYIRGLLDFLTITFLSRFNDRPMYFFGRCGILLGMIGFVICIYLVILKCLGSAIGGRPLLLLGVMLLIVSIQLFSIGFIGNMIVDNSYRRNYNENHIKEKI